MAQAGVFRRVGRFLLLTLLSIVVIAVLLVVALRYFNPPTSAFMLTARVEAFANNEKGYSTHYDWVDLENISPQAAVAVIASEDQQFPFHAGFDFKSIRAAVRSNAEGHRVRGASTISQQVAKNLFLWSGRSYFRKGLEAGFTLLIEWCWPKERILEVYLNIAQFGQGIYGVQAAAHQFFHKDARRLNRQESAELAAVLPNPLRMHVNQPSRYLMERRDWILGQMSALGGPAYLDALDAANR